MREILFRGKRIDNGEWVEGWYVPPIETDWHKFGTAISYICESGYLEDATVDPSTVGQYTGLTDKNGKRIFEGDIISIRFESDYEPPSAPDVWYENAVVIWQTEHLGWHTSFVDSGDELSMWEYDNCDDVVVIGTIHDNPELVKEGWP